MAVASLQRVKRREKILLALAFLITLSIYRSVAVSTALDQQIADSVLRLQPIGVDGRPAQVFVFRGLYELARQAAGTSLADTILYAATWLGALTCILVYFIYRELFGRRYIGIVALALVGSAPAFAFASAAASTYVVGLFFTALAIYAWLKQRWMLWGLAAGLALSSHYASATIIPPFLIWAVRSRGSIERPRRLAAAAVVGGVVAASFYYWMFSAYRGVDSWFAEQLAPAIVDLRPVAVPVEQPLFLVAYVISASALVAYFRKNQLVRRALVPAFSIGLPYVFLLWIGSQHLLGTVGLLLWAIALISAWPLLIADSRKMEITLLLFWIAPFLILAPILSPAPSDIFLFAVFPLALLACRLLDRTVDGEWLDYWWVLGLPSDWYYRLGKLAILLVISLSYLQAVRL